MPPTDDSTRRMIFKMFHLEWNMEEDFWVLYFKIVRQLTEDALPIPANCSKKVPYERIRVCIQCTTDVVCETCRKRKFPLKD